MTELRAVGTLHLLAGASTWDERPLIEGREIGPFSVGTRGDWAVSAPGVAEVHFYLAFDGRDVYAAAASTAARVLVRNVELGTTFTLLPLPCELCFGGACIGLAPPPRDVGAASAPPPPHSLSEELGTTKASPLPLLSATMRDLSPTDTLRTQLLELSPGQTLHTQLLEICSRDVPPQEKLRQIADGAPEANAEPHLVTTEESNDRERFGVVTPTTLVLGFDRLGQPLPALEGGATLCDNGALREFARGLAALEEQQTNVPHGTPNTAGAEHGQGAEPAAPKPAPARLFAAAVREFRAAPRSRKLIVALLPFAAAALFCIDGWRGTENVAQAAPHAARTAPVAASAAPAAVDTAAPGAAAATAPPTPASATALQAPATLAPRDANLEREALRAVFRGNKTQALAAYERLSKGPNAQVFELASRLVREDRVRKP